MNMSLLIGTFTIGFILSLLALGVFISFRIFAFPDITADGSITLGAAVAATLLVHGVSPPLASLAGLWRRNARRSVHRHAAHPLQDQLAALRNSGDDRALLHQSAHHGARATCRCSRSPRWRRKRSGSVSSFMAGLLPASDLAGWEVSVRDASVLVRDRFWRSR